MLNGLFRAADGMKVRLSVQELIANNLANSGTDGFQREIASIQSWGSTRSAQPAERPGIAGMLSRTPGEFLNVVSIPDTRQGALKPTEMPTDVALDGPGYLVVRSPGGLRLTRSTSLRANAQGFLATAAGDPLLSTQGRPIPVGSKKWQIAVDGTVTVEGASLGRLRVAQPLGPPRREGAQLMAVGRLQDLPAGTVRVLQGFRERSNVEPVREMVDMIAGVRAYEAAQRAVVAHDQTLQSLLEVVRR